MVTKELLIEFGLFLHKRNLFADFTVAGGAALNLLEISDRDTRDVDVVEPERLPHNIQIAALEFAADPKRGLDAGWLNTAARVYADPLPKGWVDRATLALETPGLIIRILGRDDLLKLKTYALCKRGRDLCDCVALDPTPAELENTRIWLAGLKRGEDWPRDLSLGWKLLNKELKKVRQLGHDGDFEPEMD